MYAVVVLSVVSGGEVFLVLVREAVKVEEIIDIVKVEEVLVVVDEAVV